MSIDETNQINETENFLIKIEIQIKIIKKLISEFEKYISILEKESKNNNEKTDDNTK